MENAAVDYCKLIENLERYRGGQWLGELGGILPRIQESMIRLGQPDSEYGFFSLPDLEDRFELYCTLKDRIGEHDAYWSHYDTESSQSEMSGSLASDFSDIYFELKRGLDLLGVEGADTIDVMRLWQTGYSLYWGEQLVNARQHLCSILPGIKYEMQ